MKARARTFALTLVGSLLTACASEEPAQPTAPASPPTPSQAPIAVAAPKRTVEVRNPFGNTAASDNLMVDGDFELTGLDRTATEPWRAFVKGVGQTLKMATGGRCKSGVRCLSLAPGEAAVGFMATPLQGEVAVSLWARPIGGGCGALAVHVVDFNEPSKTKMIPPPRAPDDAGGCRFEGLAPSFPGGAPAVYLEIYPRTQVTGVLVDDVVARPATPDNKNLRPAATTAASANLEAIARALRLDPRPSDPRVRSESGRETLDRLLPHRHRLVSR